MTEDWWIREERDSVKGDEGGERNEEGKEVSVMRASCS